MKYEAAVAAYMKSEQYRRLAVSTKMRREFELRRLEKHFSGYDLGKITRVMVVRVRNQYDKTPGTCHVMMGTLKAIMNFSRDQGWLKHLVTDGLNASVKPLPIKRWSNWDIETFLKTAPYHLKAVVMMALYTGQRRSDLIKIRWTDYDGKMITVKQRKTGKELCIPIHETLRKFIGTMMQRGPYILSNSRGDPWVANEITDAVKDYCRKIGINGRSLHGLRKATASILAESGCTVLQIAAITGHQSLKEVQRYTLEAEQKRMAQEAMDKWHRSQ